MKSLFPYYQVCEQNHIPVTFHCGLNGPDPHRLVSPVFRVELGDPLLLQDVIAGFPDLKIIVAHLGWPFFGHTLYLMYAYPNVYSDTSGPATWLPGRSVVKRMLIETLETVGNDRILFGSDQMAWPQMITDGVQAITEADFLNDQDKRCILWDNASELCRFPE